MKLHQQETDLTSAIEREEEAPIPRSFPGRCRRRDLWFYNEEVREHNHRVNVYKKEPNDANLRLLQDVVARV